LEKSILELTFSVSGLNEKALQTDEGIVVLEGSEAAKKCTKGLRQGYRELREGLINNVILKLVENKYIFQRDELFNTAFPAAAVIVGYNINGPQNWKDKTGKSFKEIEKERLQSIE
jgi:hypothetical protein